MSSTVQQPKEKPQQFLIRLLDLKQKDLFASQETDSELKYDPTLVHGMFVRSFSLGLQNENIKIEMKPYLEKKIWFTANPQGECHSRRGQANEKEY